MAGTRTDNLSPRQRRTRRFIGALCLAAAIVPWFFPSDVAKLVAEQDAVLLGYYSVEHFSLYLLASATLLFVGSGFLFGRPFDRQAWFRAVAVGLSVLVTLIGADAVWRMLRPVRYLETDVRDRDNWPRTEAYGNLRRRPPDARYTITYDDIPAAARSFPRRSPGFPTSEITLTIDHRGFRNQTALNDCDIVTVGDSFTEGSRVSDDEMWPVLVGNLTGRTVYNLGISGASLATYRNNLRAFGLDLKPETVILMVYEGNDLRSKADDDWESPVASAERGEQSIALAAAAHRSGLGIDENSADRDAEGNETDPPSRPFRLGVYIDRSPVLAALESALVRFLGRVNADAPIPDSDSIDWLPIEIAAGDQRTFYVFEPDRVADLYWSVDEFRATPGWEKQSRVLGSILRLCEEENIRVIVVFAPCKPHVLLPLVARDVSPARVRDFAALETDRIPSAEIYAANYLSYLDSKERAMAEFCDEEGVEFISTTVALRDAVAGGEQVYYSYDQHWTRLGHEVVARVIADSINDRAP